MEKMFHRKQREGKVILPKDYKSERMLNNCFLLLPASSILSLLFSVMEIFASEFLDFPMTLEL